MKCSWSLFFAQDVDEGKRAMQSTPHLGNVEDDGVLGPIHVWPPNASTKLWLAVRPKE